jgi:hypothetical protein
LVQCWLILPHTTYFLFMCASEAVCVFLRVCVCVLKVNGCGRYCSVLKRFLPTTYPSTQTTYVFINLYFYPSEVRNVRRCWKMFDDVRRPLPNLSKKNMSDLSATFSPWVAHTFQNDYLGRYGVSNSCQTLSRPVS